MNFFKKIFSGLKSYKKNFFTVNQTELTGLSKFLMILFFLTSLLLIAAGISSSVRQTTSPEEKYGYKCEQFVKNDYIELFDFEKSSYSMYSGFGEELVCKNLEKKYKEATDNHHIQSEISKVRSLEQKTYAISKKKRRLEEQYSNMLLEKISKQDKEKSILSSDADSVKKELDALAKKDKALKALIAKKKNILNYPIIQEFILLVDKSKEEVLTGLKKERKFFRLNKSGQVFAFLLPVWLLFYYLYKFLAKREKHIFAQLSFYVANAAMLYGLVELIQLVYRVIPKVF